MNKIQDIYKCLYFTPNGNLNKTCMGKKRCCVFYEIICPDYYKVDTSYKIRQIGIRGD